MIVEYNTEFRIMPTFLYQVNNVGDKRYVNRMQ